MREWWELMEERGTRNDMPMKPQVVAWELGKRLRDDAIVSADSGHHRHLVRAANPDPSAGRCTRSPATLATMANGPALRDRRPDRLSRAPVRRVRRRRRLLDADGGVRDRVQYGLPVKVVVVKNNTLGQIKWEQMVFLGNPEYGCDLTPIDFAAFARACGGAGYTVEDPEDCGRVLDEALAHPGPAVVEAVVDPFEPPMPPKITVRQALKFAEALAKGTPNRDKIALTVLSDKVREMV